MFHDHQSKLPTPKNKKIKGGPIKPKLQSHNASACS
uniref:Uncharacterized protein n=1 Tax=Arundo donax TaxID=35708 RepID=A0A0A8XUI3_ARUDO